MNRAVGSKGPAALFCSVHIIGTFPTTGHGKSGELGPQPAEAGSDRCAAAV